MPMAEEETADDDGGTGSNFRISYDVSPGTYFVRVVEGYSGNTTGNYTLHVRFTESSMPVVSIGDCYVGMTLSPGESCNYPGTERNLTVTAISGGGSWLSADDGGSFLSAYSDFGAISLTDLEAFHQGGGVWEIQWVEGSILPDPRDDIAVADEIGLTDSVQIIGPPPPADSLIWQYNMGSADSASVIVSPIVADGVVLATSHEGQVHALDATTGTLLWFFEADGELNPPALMAGGVVYVERGGGLTGYHALDASTGEVLWRSEAGLRMTGSFSVTETLVYEDTILGVRALDGTSGVPVWENSITRVDPSDYPALFPITVADNSVFLSQDLNSVRALDSETGALVWSFTSNYVQCEEGVVEALELQEGDLCEVPIDVSPTASGGVVFVRSYASVYALDQSNGEQLWSYETQDVAFQPDLVADGALYLSDSTLRALDTATGEPIWSFAVDPGMSDLGGCHNQCVPGRGRHGIRKHGFHLRVAEKLPARAKCCDRRGRVEPHRWRKRHQPNGGCRRCSVCPFSGWPCSRTGCRDGGDHLEFRCQLSLVAPTLRCF